MKLLRTAATIAGAAVAIAACEPVPYAVQREDIGLLPRDTAVKYLRSLPGSSEAVQLRADYEYCEFSDAGLRVAAANPAYIQRVVGELRTDAQRVARDRATAEREQQRALQLQADKPAWLRARGEAALADEMVRRQRGPQSAEDWARANGMPPEQLSQARRDFERDRADFEKRLSAAADSKMLDERLQFTNRIEALDRDARAINKKIVTVQDRGHGVAHYDRAAFVVYRRLGGEMNIDVQYETPEQDRIDGCGFEIDPQKKAAISETRRIATALASLGAEGQPGVRAEPPLRDGRRYSASPLISAPPAKPGLARVE